MQRFRLQVGNWSFTGLTMVGILMTMGVRGASSSDHLDTPTVIADPAADIGDIFAWTSSDGKRLNLVMDIVAHQFSDHLQYVFHVDSGKRFGKTPETAGGNSRRTFRERLDSMMVLMASAAINGLPIPKGNHPSDMNASRSS